MFERVFVWLTGLSGGITYWIVFGILVACGLGFPLPEDLPLIATGYLIWDGTMEWPIAFAVTMFGVCAGDTILFFIGQKLGMRFVEGKKIQTLFPKERIRRVRAYFRKFGGKVVFFARFVAGFRAVAFFLAGALGVPYRRFILLDMLAALISVPVWILIGYMLGHYLGDEISDILSSMRHLKTYFTAGITLIVVVVLTRTVLKWRQLKKDNAAKRSARRSRANPVVMLFVLCSASLALADTPEVDADDAEKLYMKGVTLQREKGKEDEGLRLKRVAWERANKLVKDFPQFPRAHHLLGELYRAEGKLTEADKEFNACLKLDPAHRLCLRSADSLAKLRAQTR